MEHCLNSFSQESSQNHLVETCKVYQHLDTSPTLRLRRLLARAAYHFEAISVRLLTPKKQIKINEIIEKTNKQQRRT